MAPIANMVTKPNTGLSNFGQVFYCNQRLFKTCSHVYFASTFANVANMANMADMVNMAIMAKMADMTTMADMADVDHMADIANL